MTERPPQLPEDNNADDSRYLPPDLRPNAEDPVVQTQTDIVPSELPPKPAGASMLHQPPQNESPGQRALWGFAGAGGCLLVLALLVVVPALLAAGTFGGGMFLVGNTLNNILNPAPPSAGVTSSQTIVQGIQPLGQLVSTSAQVAKADIEVFINQGAFAVCNHSANHVASATINAGIDLLQVEASSVTYDEESDTYTLRVPQPQITGCSMDFIDQYQRWRNGPTCTVDWDDARQIAQYEAMVAFRDEAIEGGLLVTAERDARAALTNFIIALTGSNVVIEFIEVTGETEINACEPQAPRDWSFDAAARTWVRLR